MQLIIKLFPLKYCCMNEPFDKHPQKNNSKRIEALSDGIFAITSTLLVLEIRVPELQNSSVPEMMDSLSSILPSLIGFIFSFLNILIFWVNHDSIGKTLKHFDTKLIYLNIIFLLFISINFLIRKIKLFSRYI